MHSPREDRLEAWRSKLEVKKTGGDLNNPVYQNSHIAALNANVSDSRKPNTSKKLNTLGTHFSGKNSKTPTRSDSDEYVYPDIPQARSSNLDALGSMNKLQTGQVIRGTEYGIYDDANAEAPKHDSRTLLTTRQDSNNWFFKRRWKILLGLAVLITILLAIIVICVTVFAKPSNLNANTTTTMSTSSTSTAMATEPTTTKSKPSICC